MLNMLIYQAKEKGVTEISLLVEIFTCYKPGGPGWQLKSEELAMKVFKRQ